MTHEEKFIKFHEENPEVYNTLVMLSFRWKRRHPHRVCGIAMLWEVMRWTLSIETNDEPYKLNNNHKAYYARMLMANGYATFNTRELRAA